LYAIALDLKARVLLKTDRLAFNAALALRSKQEARSKTPKMECKNCFSTTKQQANSKKQSAKNKML